jgi:hypothetical protein
VTTDLLWSSFALLCLAARAVSIAPFGFDFEKNRPEPARRRLPLLLSYCVLASVPPPLIYLLAVPSLWGIPCG